MRFPKAPVAAPKADPRAIRMKTYAAQSGYVFQYFFAGEDHANGARNYRFQVSANRAAESAVRIEIPDVLLNEWQAGRHRQLSPTECYAVAKMHLFATLDSDGFTLTDQAVAPVTMDSLDSIAAALDLL